MVWIVLSNFFVYSLFTVDAQKYLKIFEYENELIKPTIINKTHFHIAVNDTPIIFKFIHFLVYYQAFLEGLIFRKRNSDNMTFCFHNYSCTVKLFEKSKCKALFRRDDRVIVPVIEKNDYTDCLFHNDVQLYGLATLYQCSSVSGLRQSKRLRINGTIAWLLVDVFEYKESYHFVFNCSLFSVILRRKKSPSSSEPIWSAVYSNYSQTFKFLPIKNESVLFAYYTQEDTEWYIERISFDSISKQLDKADENLCTNALDTSLDEILTGSKVNCSNNTIPMITIYPGSKTVYDPLEKLIFFIPFYRYFPDEEITLAFLATGRVVCLNQQLEKIECRLENQLSKLMSNISIERWPLTTINPIEGQIVVVDNDFLARKVAIFRCSELTTCDTCEIFGYFSNCSWIDEECREIRAKKRQKCFTIRQIEIFNSTKPYYIHITLDEDMDYHLNYLVYFVVNNRTITAFEKKNNTNYYKVQIESTKLVEVTMFVKSYTGKPLMYTHYMNGTMDDEYSDYLLPLTIIATFFFVIILIIGCTIFQLSGSKFAFTSLAQSLYSRSSRWRSLLFSKQKPNSYLADSDNYLKGFLIKPTPSVESHQLIQFKSPPNSPIKSAPKSLKKSRRQVFHAKDDQIK